jgi:hypothetical protein
LLIQNGKVIAAGTSVNIPKKTITVNLEGNLFIPLICILVLKWTTKKTEGSRQSQSYDTKREGYYWNDPSEVNAYDNFNYDQPKAEELLKGIWCSRHACARRYRESTGSLIALNNSDKTNRLLTAKVSNHFGFQKCYFKPSVS